MNSVRSRQRDGAIFLNMIPQPWEWRYGYRITAARMLHGLAVFCLGCRIAGKNRAVDKLRPPYPVLYHFTAESNIPSILTKGLLPLRGRVYLTDWTDERWCARLKNSNSLEPMVCFRVDTDRMIKFGHEIAAMNALHEFTTDCVPPDCLELTALKMR